MKYIDNDMDELFNKAGRHYPLRTEPKDWDAVHKALLDGEGSSIPSKKNNYKRYYPFLLLLLLVPFLFIKNDRDIQRDSDRRDAINSSNANSDIKVKKTQGPITNDQASPNEDKQAKVLNPAVGTTQEIKNAETGISYVPPARRSLKARQGEELRNIKGGLKNSPLAGDKDQPLNPITAKETNNNYPLTGKAGSPARLGNNVYSDVTSLEVLRSWILYPPLDSDILVDGPSTEISVNAPVKLSGTLNEVQPLPDRKKKQNIHSRKVYYGVIAGPDLTTIKSQEIKKVGYNIGILVGYSFSKHWSIEAGGLWSRKKYYTDGKYFDKSAAQIPSNIYISHLEGGCDMFEFPIAVRYDFSAKKNSFFGTVGLTSYIMKKESYDFSASYGGSPYERFKSYPNSGDHLFSNVQLSAGYNYKLSTKLNIRIEPYLKMPLKKIGIGKMPITSTGVNFGLLRDLN